MNFIYEAVIGHDEDGYSVTFPQFPEAATFGASREEAVSRARDALVLALSERIDEGGEIPPQKRTVEVVAISVDVDSETVDMSKCLTMEQAAEELGVTTGRISQLASSGKLDAVVIGRRKMVTIASVEKRKELGARPGRPRKAAIA